MNEEVVHKPGSNVFVNVYDSVSLLPACTNSVCFKKESINTIIIDIITELSIISNTSSVCYIYAIIETTIDIYAAYLSLSSHMMKLLITGIHLFISANIHLML